MNRYLITQWFGVKVVQAGSFKLTEHGMEFYIDGELIETNSSKKVEKIGNETIISI